MKKDLVLFRKQTVNDLWLKQSINKIEQRYRQAGFLETQITTDSRIIEKGGSVGFARKWLGKSTLSLNFRYENINEASEMLEKAIDYWSLKKSKEISSNSKRFNEDHFSKRFIDIFNTHFP